MQLLELETTENGCYSIKNNIILYRKRAAGVYAELNIGYIYMCVCVYVCGL